MRPSVGFFLVLVPASLAGAATFQEDFSQDPAARGWQVFGDADLFQWNATNQNLEVTWDSSQPNSYFVRPLGTILTRSDDFSFEFDITMSDISIGIDPEKPDTFELAVSLINLQSATNASLERGTGVNALHGARNVVEFDYFPDSGYGATVSPTLLSSNNQFATGFYFPLEVDPGALFHIAMSYTASNLTLATAMTRNGQPFGPIGNVVLRGSFTDFRLDHFGFPSYSDAGADGSILAHGVVDNVLLTMPPAPVSNLKAGFSNAVWQVQFASLTNWLYTLQRSDDFLAWTNVAGATSGNGTNLLLADPDAPPGAALYRVRADRP
jgi:hypothetical protein